MELKRNPHNLSQTEYDLLVIGGGIYGACVAWDATLRGLSVAIVEQADFASATSANSLKIIHGGFRYLQSADIRRMRESVRERRTLMRIAPHLVHPLPVLIPTFKRLMQRKEILTFAMMINDVIGFDRNRGSESQKRIPRSRMVSRSEVARTLPGLGERGVTGGVLVYDAQVYNSERLVISFLRSAAEAGAELCNYMQVTGFLRNGDSVIGVKAQDTLTGDEIEIRAKAVVNTSGPWFNRVLGLLGEHQSSTEASFATAMNIVIGRQLFEDYAVGIPSRRENGDASGNESNQYLFVSPWRGRSLIGTAYSQYTGRPEDLKFT